MSAQSGLALEFLSAPLWLLWALQIFSLTLHLLAMNCLLGGLIAVLWGKLSGHFDHPVVQRFIRRFPSIMAATISLGVAPLLFVQLVYGRLFYTAAVISAWYWLAILPALVLAYYSLYAAAYGNAAPDPARADAEVPGSSISGKRTGQLLSLALVALLFISLVYSASFALAEQPDLEGQLYAKLQSGLVLNPMLSSWVLRWLHMILGAVMVGGFFLSAMGEAEPCGQASDQAFAVGKRFFLWGLGGACLAGLAYVGSLGPLLRPFMKSPGIWTLMVAVMLSLGATHFLMQRRLWIAGPLLLLSLAGMVMTRHFLRLLRLEGIYDPSTLPVASNWPLVGLFMLSFVLMVGILAYMARLYWRAPLQK